MSDKLKIDRYCVSCYRKVIVRNGFLQCDCTRVPYDSLFKAGEYPVPDNWVTPNPQKQTNVPKLPIDKQ